VVAPAGSPVPAQVDSQAAGAGTPAEGHRAADRPAAGRQAGSHRARGQQAGSWAADREVAVVDREADREVAVVDQEADREVAGADQEADREVAAVDPRVEAPRTGPAGPPGAAGCQAAGRPAGVQRDRMADSCRLPRSDPR